MRIRCPLFLVLLLLFLCCDRSQTKQSWVVALPRPAIPLSAGSKINGLTFVAPPEPFPANPMPAVRELGAAWIAVVPYAFLRPGTTDVIFDEHGGQWWGERPEGVVET